MKYVYVLTTKIRLFLPFNYMDNAEVYIYVNCKVCTITVQ